MDEELQQIFSEFDKAKQRLNNYISSPIYRNKVKNMYLTLYGDENDLLIDNHIESLKVNMDNTKLVSNFISPSGYNFGELDNLVAYKYWIPATGTTLLDYQNVNNKTPLSLTNSAQELKTDPAGYPIIGFGKGLINTNLYDDSIKDTLSHELIHAGLGIANNHFTWENMSEEEAPNNIGNYNTFANRILDYNNNFPVEIKDEEYDSDDLDWNDYLNYLMLGEELRVRGMKFDEKYQEELEKALKYDYEHGTNTVNSITRESVYDNLMKSEQDDSDLEDIKYYKKDLFLNYSKYFVQNSIKNNLNLFYAKQGIKLIPKKRFIK